MFGCDSAATARASRANRSRIAGWSRVPDATVLIATFRRKRASCARYTSPIPPRPIGSMILYGPTFDPGSMSADSAFSLLNLSISEGFLSSWMAASGSGDSLRSATAGSTRAASAQLQRSTRLAYATDRGRLVRCNSGGVQRSTWSSIQISLRDSLIGRSRCVAVMPMSIWTVRGVNSNCADRNDVTGNGSPIGVPVALSNRRPQTLATPVRFDTKYRIRPSGPHRGLSSNHAPSVIARHVPPAAGMT